jgi:hypothetical protein
MIYFATLFDKNYISRALVLYESLNKNCLDFTLYTLCLDIDSYNYLIDNDSAYSKLIPLKLSEIEDKYLELNIAKSNRSLIEYYFTLSPFLPLYLLETYKIPFICTLDADIIFYSSPHTIFSNLDKYSIIITPHNFSKKNIHLEKFGKYNVSFQVFKSNSVAISCLKSWASQCLLWCKDELDFKNGRFADQKYLDTWEYDFPREVKILSESSCGVAPWNISNLNFINSKGKCNLIGDEIIFFHFHQFKIFSNSLAQNRFMDYFVTNNKFLEETYLDYWSKVEAYDLNLPFKKAHSIREKSSKSVLNFILNTNGFYFRYSNRLYYFNIKRHKDFIYRIIYGLFHRSSNTF